MTDRHVELGLDPEVAVRELLLVGGPADGGHVYIPAAGKGEFVIHHIPLDLEEFQNAITGEWDYRINGGGGTCDPVTGEPLGSMVYKVDEIGWPIARFVRADHNPVNEDLDGDLEPVARYLLNPPLVEEIATEDDS